MDLVMLGALSDFCTQMSGLLKFVGIVLWIFKVAIPIMIVIFGMIDLGKAVTASKDDEIKKAMKQLAVRLAAGVLIFFIPTIIVFVFEMITEFNTAKNAVTFDQCRICLLEPGKCTSTEIAD